MTDAITNKAAVLTAASAYVANGWHVFLCGTDKKPLQRGGFKNASTDIGRLDKSLARHPDGMLAIRTGVESGIVVIDVDVDIEKGIDGRPYFEAARTRGLPDCPIVQTPRGGLHLYFAHPGETISNSAGRLAPGVDVRGDGGYIVAAPSRSPRGEYRWLRPPAEVSPPPIPDWLRDELKAPKRSIIDESNAAPSQNDLKEIADEFEASLGRVRTSKEGSRNDTLNRNAYLVGKMVGAGVLDRNVALERLIEAAVSGGLPADESRRTAESGLRSGIRRPWQPRAAEPELSLINRDYFYSLDGRSGFVFREERDPLTGRAMLQHISPGAFREQFGNRWFMIDGPKGPRQCPLGDAWMKWPRRRQYDKVVFAPGKDLPASTYNMWQGFTAEPIAGNCEKFVGLLRDVICSNDPGSFEYLLAWMARAVQQPWNPGEVAVVMRGEKGTGKTFFAEHFGDLFGEHFVQMSSSHHLVGNFNAHLETAIIAFADEAFWAGDKQGEGTLKTLITGKTIRIERKGIDSKQVPNHVHLIMASNSDWVVPASHDERRYFVLDVSDAHRQDHAYFAEIEAEWLAGGREACMHMLVNHGLKGFNVRAVPVTDALLAQKLLSLLPVDRWYLELLRIGTNDAGKLHWLEWVETQILWGQFTAWCDEQRAFPSSMELFGIRLQRLLPPTPNRDSRRCQRTTGQSKRAWGYQLPPLPECRTHFESIIGAQIEWDQHENVLSAPDDGSEY